MNVLFMSMFVIYATHVLVASNMSIKMETRIAKIVRVHSTGLKFAAKFTSKVPSVRITAIYQIKQT